MKTPLPKIKGIIKCSLPVDATETIPEPPKPPSDLTLFFMLSHLEDDGPVRLDGVKLSVSEVMGLELDEPKLGAFAGSLNALDFPVQLLVRQHPPVLAALRSKLDEAQPGDLPQQTKDAADSLGRLLGNLEQREGILDRRFYAVCEHARMDELRGLLVRAGLGVFPLVGEPLRLFWLSAALGGSPTERDEDLEMEVEVNRRDIRIGDRMTRSLHLGKWPRSLAPGFLQALMATGAPMDLAVHLGAIPSEQAARTLEWQKVRFESAQSLSFKRGRSMSPEAEIALEDVSRLRDEVQRGRERLFHASLSVTLHAEDQDTLKDLTQKARAHFAATLGKLDNLAFRQREGLLSTLPLALNAVAVWRTLDTSSLARLFPFSPPDLDTRSGTLYGIDLRACAPVVYDPFDGTHLNANTAVLARSGSGKSFATKLGVLRGVCRGVRAYVIDPEGEYADMARAAGGRVLSPGITGQGMNPFVIDRGDSEELLQRIGSLRRLIEVMVGERLSAERRSSLDHALAGYYAEHRERTGFRDFYAYLEQEGGGDIAHLLRPFATGSLRHLLSDEGDDLLTHEALVTVFDLHLLEPELRPAAAMVCTETVWAAAAQDPRPRLLVVDEVWSIMQHPEGAAFMVSMAKRARKHRLGLQFITQDVQDLLSEDSSRTITGHSGRALLQKPPSSYCFNRTPPPSPPWGKPSTCRWNCNAGSCPAHGETGCCWRGATAFPSASRPPPRRPRSSSGAPDPGTRPNTKRKRDNYYEYQREEYPAGRPPDPAEVPGIAGGDTPPHRREDPAGSGEHAPVHRRPRALLPGTGRGHRRRDSPGSLPGRPGGEAAALRPLPPGPHPPGAPGGRPFAG